jgi:hypothetical protein
MNRKIVITVCGVCPHKDHKGAFGQVSYIPYCKSTGQELPYTISTGMLPGKYGGPLSQANPTGVIPDWCPLEFNNF